MSIQESLKLSNKKLIFKFSNFRAHNFIKLKCKRGAGVIFHQNNLWVVRMAKYLIARQISGKKIVTNEGEDFGTVVDLSVNEVTGKIESLVVEPNPESPTAAKMSKEDGSIMISYESVLSVGDYIIVERRNMLN